MLNNICRSVGSLGLATLLISTAVPALAHPKVETAMPAADSTSASPKKISLQMSEKFEPKFSGLELTKVGGPPVPIVPTVGGADGKTMEAAPKGRLTPGRYKVMWHAVGADGHRVKGDYSFTVK